MYFLLCKKSDYEISHYVNFYYVNSHYEKVVLCICYYVSAHYVISTIIWYRALNYRKMRIVHSKSIL